MKGHRLRDRKEINYWIYERRTIYDKWNNENN